MKSLEERFTAKFKKDKNDCWLWAASVTPKGKRTTGGYGMFHLSVNSKEKLAHRIAWMIYRGSIPAGKCVLHRCDRRNCVNPEHLFLGTHVDNTRDMDRKGRRVVKFLEGERHPMSRLSARDVLSIKAAQRKGAGPRLAKQYDVCSSTIYNIWRGITWTCVEGKSNV